MYDGCHSSVGRLKPGARFFSIGGQASRTSVWEGFDPPQQSFHFEDGLCLAAKSY